MAIRELDGVEVKGKIVMVRVDYNVPLEKGQVQDNSRILESLDTVRYLIERGAAKIVILSHLGRPVGNVVEELRLAPVVQELSQLIGEDVDYLPNNLDEVNRDMISESINKIVCLENIRFDRREESGDIKLAEKLAKLADMFVLDGFSVAHREHASVTVITQFLPSYAGFGFVHEKRQIDDFIKSVRRPFWGIFGGLKLSDKIPVIKSLTQMDGLLLGSSIAMAVLQRFGFDIGASMVAKDSNQAVDELVEMINARSIKTIFPSDLLVGVVNEDKVTKVVDIDINKVIKQELLPFSLCDNNEAIFDVGEKTITNFCEILSKAGSVFWNGPLGMAEKTVYANGTKSIADFLGKLPAIKMIGGGDTISVLKNMGMTHEYEYVSTSGGAMMEYIAKGTLPGIEVLSKE